MQNYQCNIQTDSSPNQVFQAITKELDLWWGKTDRTITGVNDEFKIFFGKAFWQFRVTEYLPDEKLTWLCIDGQPEFENEWVGTTIYWNIELINGKTELTMEHDGLTPEFSCYDVCAPTWDMFITSSLMKFLKQGVGTPH